MRPRSALRGRAVTSYAMVLSALSLCLAGCGGATRGGARGVDIDREIEFGLRSARAGLWNEALYRFERAAKVRPDDAALHNNLAVAYEHEGRYEEAEREYEMASTIAPGNDYIKKNVEAFKAFRAGKPIRPDDEEKPEEPAATPPAQAAGGQQPDVS